MPAVDAVRMRHPVRRFLPRQVPHGTLHATSSRWRNVRLSNWNAQPWLAHVVSGTACAGACHGLRWSQQHMRPTSPATAIVETAQPLLLGIYFGCEGPRCLRQCLPSAPRGARAVSGALQPAAESARCASAPAALLVLRYARSLCAPLRIHRRIFFFSPICSSTFPTLAEKRSVSQSSHNFQRFSSVGRSR